jgi:hypothetical protein
MESVDPFHFSIPPPNIPSRVSQMRRIVHPSAFALVQALIASGIIVIGGLASVQALVMTNNKAASMRTLNNARSIVQRNIDAAMSVPFSASVQPAILGFTAAVPYDETGGAATTVNIVTSRDGVGSVVRGTLWRSVTAEPNADGADIRRIKFRVDYTYRLRKYSFEMTTLRAPD